MFLHFELLFFFFKQLGKWESLYPPWMQALPVFVSHEYTKFSYLNMLKHQIPFLKFHSMLTYIYYLVRLRLLKMSAEPRVNLFMTIQHLKSIQWKLNTYKFFHYLKQNIKCIRKKELCISMQKKWVCLAAETKF